MTAVLIAAVALLLLIALYAAVTYNRLVALRNNAISSWAQIDVALRQRYDLVPPLVDSVAGYAGHERATLERVTEARARAMAEQAAGPARRAASEAELGSGVRGAVLIAEDYPDLKASENFAGLQAKLAELEEKISITRRVYNDTVETYNTKIQVFPPVLIANAFGFEAREFFDAPAAAESAPEVRIGG